MPKLKTDKTSVHNTNHQITAYLFERAQPEIIIGLISALLTTFLFWEHIEQTSLFYWTASAILIYLLRFLIIRGEQTSEVRRVRSLLFLLSLIFCGILWGAAGYSAILQESITHQTGALIWIIFLSFLITMIYSGKLPYVLAFIIPAIALPAYSLLDQSSSPASPMLLYTFLTTGIFLLTLAQIYHNSFLSGLRSRAEHEQLLAEHELLIEKIEEIKITLKSTTNKGHETQGNLDQASKDLAQSELRKKSLATSLISSIRIDPVTNLSNRKEFFKTVQQEWQRATRSKDPLTIAYINIDEFDTLNEKNDKKTIVSTLKKIGASIKLHGRRAGDLPARIDKAGFALLLIGADSKNASKIIENIRDSINNLNLSINEKDDPVTVHAGVATLTPNLNSNPAELLDNVESAAYEAGFRGGDQVVSFHTFSTIETNLWDPIKDGELNETNFQQKLLKLGYNTKREVIPPKTSFRDQSFTKATLFAVFSGHFLLNIEGQGYELKHGSSLILPKDISFGAEVIDDTPVILYLEKR